MIPAAKAQPISPDEWPTTAAGINERCICGFQHLFFQRELGSEGFQCVVCSVECSSEDWVVTSKLGSHGSPLSSLTGKDKAERGFVASSKGCCNCDSTRQVRASFAEGVSYIACKQLLEDFRTLLKENSKIGDFLLQSLRVMGGEHKKTDGGHGSLESFGSSAQNDMSIGTTEAVVRDRDVLLASRPRPS
ncbi:putative polyketide synthase, partial [Aureobasidium melanogenum]